MIDIHCHILPAVDDGARSLEDSIAMGRAAAEQGIRTIVATPHHRNNQFYNKRDDIIRSVKELNRVFNEEEIPVKILPGQEVRIYGELMEGIDTKEILPVNINTPYILIELPSSSVPKYTKELLYNLQIEGYTPIIVHPERNNEFLENPDKLYELVKSGVLTQITAGSIVGNFGKKIKEFSKQILQADLTHFIASDSHNLQRRGFMMRTATQQIIELYGEDAMLNFHENATRMVTGETVVGEVPKRIKRRKFLGIF
jgi:protein-tyrosine phosphatase